MSGIMSLEGRRREEDCGAYMPDKETIAEECRKIQKNWTPYERLIRAGKPPVNLVNSSSRRTWYEPVEIHEVG